MVSEFANFRVLNSVSPRLRVDDHGNSSLKLHALRPRRSDDVRAALEVTRPQRVEFGELRGARCAGGENAGALDGVQVEHQARHHRNGHAAGGAVSGAVRAQGRTGANDTYLLAKVERQLTRRGCSRRDVSG